MQKKEIELKAKVENVSKLLSKIKSLGFAEVVTHEQEDEWYGDSRLGGFRIRHVDNKVFFTVKKLYGGIGSEEWETDDLDKVSILLKEFKIKEKPTSVDALRYLLDKTLGRAQNLKKTRTTWRYKDAEITLDKDVTAFFQGKTIKLGDWLEIEVPEGQEELMYSVFESLGFKKSELIDKSYGMLMHEALVSLN